MLFQEIISRQNWEQILPLQQLGTYNAIEKLGFQGITSQRC